MLSLKRGKPIARIIDSKSLAQKGGKSYYLGLIPEKDIESGEKTGYKTDPYYLIGEDEVIKEVKSVKPKIVRKKLKEKVEKKSREEYGKQLILNDGIIRSIPDTELERDCFYISGNSGAGKSYFTANFVEEYCEMFPENPIVMFSMVDQDEAFERFENNDKYCFNRIHLNKDYLENITNDDAIKISDLYNSIVIFDDVDMISNKKMREYVTDLRTMCLQVGRHNRITVMTTSHVMCNNTVTRDQINESNNVVFFPKNGSTHQIRYFLERYCDLDKETIRNIMKIPSRWIQIHKAHPKYILYNDGAKLLDL